MGRAQSAPVCPISLDPAPDPPPPVGVFRVRRSRERMGIFLFVFLWVFLVCRPRPKPGSAGAVPHRISGATWNIRSGERRLWELLRARPSAGTTPTWATIGRSPPGTRPRFSKTTASVQRSGQSTTMVTCTRMLNSKLMMQFFLKKMSLAPTKLKGSVLTKRWAKRCHETPKIAQ